MAKTVLLLEDDRSFRQLVIPLLRARGLAVVEAARASDATRLLASSPELAKGPDLIVVDGLLPDGNGADWLRSLPPQVRARPTVFVSAFWKSLKDHRTLQQELGVALIVHKPVSPESLVEQIDRLLGQADQPGLPPEVAREMAKLKAEYARELAGKLEELRRAVRLARQAPGDARARHEARSLAHRLSGTAGSYGFPDESDAAGLVESHAIAAEKAAPQELGALWEAAERAVADALLARVVADG